MNTLAIIGLGPRGLFALEQVLMHLGRSHLDKNQINIIVFERCQQPGAGQVWYTDQSNSNWVNISERALAELQGRPKIRLNDYKIEAFPSYHEWSNFSQNELNPDTFPPRRKIGQYLFERYQSLQQDMPLFKMVQAEVKQIHTRSDYLSIETTDDQYICDDIVLTIGHQPTTLSEQINSWKTHFADTEFKMVFEDTYPLNQFKKLKNETRVNVAVRGFGLAMIDLVRELSINNFGHFEIIDPSTFKTKYVKYKEQHLSIIPFSLDGLPLAPKPLNEYIDNWFKPTQEEIRFFKNAIEAIAQTNNVANSVDFLITPISKIIARVYHNLNEKAIPHHLTENKLETIIRQWLNDSSYEHYLIQDQHIETYDLISVYINMALGKCPIALDYCIGQVWRHCQPTLYKSFSHAKLDNDVINDVISLDDRSKRYSYGPPIESMQQLLALVEADILNLNYVKDPKIDLSEDGWHLVNDKEDEIKCSIMINSVLNSPQLLNVNASLIKHLLENDVIQSVHSKLGIDTARNGYIITPEEFDELNIAVLGRLAKGSVIGVDAILECFGQRIEDWANYYVSKITN